MNTGTATGEKAVCRIARGALIRENHFYNQLYCGCEFSMRGLAERMARQSEQAKKDEEAAREKIDAALQSISKSA